MDLFGAVSAEDMRLARIVTGATMAALIGIRFAPGLRARAGAITLVLLALYLLGCGGLVVAVLMR